MAPIFLGAFMNIDIIGLCMGRAPTQSGSGALAGGKTIGIGVVVGSAISLFGLAIMVFSDRIGRMVCTDVRAGDRAASWAGLSALTGCAVMIVGAGLLMYFRRKAKRKI